MRRLPTQFDDRGAPAAVATPTCCCCCCCLVSLTTAVAASAALVDASARRNQVPAGQRYLLAAVAVAAFVLAGLLVWAAGSVAGGPAGVAAGGVLLAGSLGVIGRKAGISHKAAWVLAVLVVLLLPAVSFLEVMVVLGIGEWWLEFGPAPTFWLAYVLGAAGTATLVVMGVRRQVLGPRAPGDKAGPRL